MEVYMKKIGCILISLLLVFSGMQMAFAESEFTNILGLYNHNAWNVTFINNNRVFTYQTKSLRASIVIDNENILQVSIANSNEPDKIFQWIIDDCSDAIPCKSSDNMLDIVLDYAIKHIEDSEKIAITNVTYNEPIDITSNRLSSVADLKSDLATLVGTEFSNRLKCSRTYHAHTFNVYETMQFRIYEKGYATWNTAITVATLITSVLGFTNNAPSLVSTICNAFGVADSLYSLLAPGQIKKYECQAFYYHYTVMPGSDNIYNTTFKTIIYNGYEDANPNSSERAYVDSGSQQIIYTEDETYYYSYTSQIEDAYDRYLLIG